MVEQVLAAMVVTAIVITAIGIVVGISNPLIEASKETTVMRDAENIISLIDNSIREVVKEGPQAKRILNIQSGGSLETLPGEDAVQFSFPSRAGLLDYLTRFTRGNLVFVAGNDVGCTNSTNLTMENTFLNVTLRKTERRSPLSAINTTESIISITEKTRNTRVRFANSSIVINDNQSTARGTGYSEILSAGTGRPACTAHFFVNNSAIEYDIFYTLYAGADFLAIDVRGVKEK